MPGCILLGVMEGKEQARERFDGGRSTERITNSASSVCAGGLQALWTDYLQMERDPGVPPISSTSNSPAQSLESESADGEVEGIDEDILREMQAGFCGELLPKDHSMKLTEMGYNVLRNAGIRPYPARRGPREHDPTPPPASGAQQDQLYAAAFYFDEAQMQAHSYRMMVNRPKKGRPEGVPEIDRGDVTPPPSLPEKDGRNDGLRRFANRENFEQHANGVLYPNAPGRKLTAGNADKLWKLSNFFVNMREKGIILGLLDTGGLGINHIPPMPNSIFGFRAILVRQPEFHREIVSFLFRNADTFKVRKPRQRRDLEDAGGTSPSPQPNPPAAYHEPETGPQMYPEALLHDATFIPSQGLPGEQDEGTWSQDSLRHEGGASAQHLIAAASRALSNYSEEEEKALQQELDLDFSVVDHEEAEALLHATQH